MRLGDFYRALRLSIERVRIGRFEAAEAIDRQAIAIEILRLRSRSLVIFLLMAALTTALDLQFAGSLEDAGLPTYLEKRLHLPDLGGLRDFASALAVAVATITAMLLSISLVVLQNAGQRYGGRLIRYLLGERVSRYVLDLLLLTLIFSIWTIAFLLLVESTPFFSLAALSGLVLVSILSLPVYREHTLAMLAPRASVDVLANEVIRTLRRIPTRETGGSRSVADWLRRSSAARLADIHSLVEPLLSGTNRDAESAGHIGLRLQAILVFYASLKHQIPTGSGWFPLTHQPVPREDRFAFIERRRMFDQLGLGRPVQQAPDQDWFERRVFALLGELLDRSLEVGAMDVPAGLLTQLELTVEKTFRLQSEPAFREALSFAERIANSLPKGSDESGQVINYAVTIAQVAIKGTDWAKWRDQGISMIRRLPATRDVWRWRAPAAVEDILLKTRSKLQLEETLMGHLLTPEAWLRPELEDDLNNVHLDYETRAFSSAVRCISEVVNREGLNSEVAVAGVYAILLLWHQCLLQGRDSLEDLLPQDRVQRAAAAVIELQAPEAQGKEWEAALTDEIVSCCMLILLEGTHFDQFKNLVDPLIVRVLMPFGSDTEMLDAIHRLQAVAGLALLISEIRQIPSLSDAVVERVLQFLQDDSDRWKGFEDRWKLAIDPTLAFMYGLQESLQMKYHSYFLRAWQEIKDIGEVPIDPKRSLAMTLDHPSDFLRRNAIYGTVDPVKCAEEFLERLKSRRPSAAANDDERDTGNDPQKDR